MRCSSLRYVRTFIANSVVRLLEHDVESTWASNESCISFSSNGTSETRGGVADIERNSGGGRKGSRASTANKLLSQRVNGCD